MGSGASVEGRTPRSPRLGAKQSSNESSGKQGVLSPKQKRGEAPGCQDHVHKRSPGKTPTSSDVKATSPVGGIGYPRNLVTATVQGPLEPGEEATEETGTHARSSAARRAADVFLGHGAPKVSRDSPSGGGAAEITPNANSPRGLLNSETEQQSEWGKGERSFQAKSPLAAKPPPHPLADADGEEKTRSGGKSRPGCPGQGKRGQRAPNLNDLGCGADHHGSPSIVTPTFVPPQTQLYRNMLRDKGIQDGDGNSSSSSPKLFTFGLENVLEKQRQAKGEEPVVLTEEYMDKMWEDINRSFTSLQEHMDNRAAAGEATPEKKGSSNVVPELSPVARLETPSKLAAETPATPLKKDTLNLLMKTLEFVDDKAAQKFYKNPKKLRECKQLISGLQEHILHLQPNSDWDASVDRFLMKGLQDLIQLLTHAKSKRARNGSGKFAVTETEGKVSGRRSPDGAPRGVQGTPAPLVFIDPEVEHSDTSGQVAEETTLSRREALPDPESFAEDQRPADPKDVKIDKHLGVPLTDNWVYAEKIMEFRRQLVELCAQVQKAGRSRRAVFGRQLYELIKLTTKMNRAGWNVGSYKNVEPVLRRIVDHAKTCALQYADEDASR